MLDQEKIVLMSRLASYEKYDGKKDVAISHYFRNDYIGWQVLKTLISATIIYIIIIAGYVVYNFETIMVDIYKLNLQEYGKDVLTKYCIFAGSLAVITYILYSYRYAKARKSLRAYARNLAKLAEKYKKEEK